MPRSASRKRARDMKDPVKRGAKIRDLAFKREMEELSRVGMSERPEWLGDRQSVQVVGGDRAMRSRVRQSQSDKVRNRAIRNKRDDVRDANGRVVHPKFRSTEDERVPHVVRQGVFVPVGPSNGHMDSVGYGVPETPEQSETRVGMARYRKHENDVRKLYAGVVFTSTGVLTDATGTDSVLVDHDKHHGTHVHKSTCFADICKGASASMGIAR